MYGIGAILMIALGKVSDNPIIIFIISFILFSVWEYIVAVILEKCFKTKYWDYSNLKFNLQGRICLKNSIYWGILGVLLIFLIQPVIKNLTNRIPIDIIIYIEVIFCLAITVDATITIFRIMFIDKRIRQIFEIGDIIKYKINELKKYSEEANYKANIQRIITELNVKQDILKIKVYKRIIKFRKAFPNMTSENITKFMLQKVELKELKEKIKKYKER